MQPHSPEQVLQMKSFVDSQPNGKGRKTYKLSGLEVVYTSMHLSDDDKPFNYAVAAFVIPRDSGRSMTEEDYEISVSDDVPEELQGLWAWHELHDFGVLGHRAENRCLQSEEEILSNLQADPKLLKQYLQYRIPFYEGLAAFIVKDIDQNGYASVYRADDLEGCYDAIKLLESQNEKLRADHVELPRFALVSIAKVKRIELDALNAEQTAKRQAANGRARDKRAELAAQNAELKLESDRNAAEFIKLMELYKIPTTDFYKQERTLLKKETGGYDYDSRSYDADLWYKVKTTRIGAGWKLGTIDKRIILLPNGKAYAYSTNFWNEAKEGSFRNYRYTHFTGDIPTEDSVNSTSVNGVPMRGALFAGEGSGMLIDEIIKLGIDKTA